MAIKDLDQAALVVKLYSDLEIANVNAKAWTDQVMKIKNQLAEMPIYRENASAADIAFCDNSYTASDVFDKSVPTPPSKFTETESAPPLPGEPIL